jgi:hypothetical protein
MPRFAIGRKPPLILLDVVALAGILSFVVDAIVGFGQ